MRVRDAFYLGMYPLVPFLLLFALASVQLVPLVVSGTLYSYVIAGHIAVHAWEIMLWVVLCLGLALWSLRMVTATVFALYIVTLPDMTPVLAWRSARQLVDRRRLYIWRKLLFLPVAMLVCAAVIEIPIILYLAPVAPWMLFALTTLALPVLHGYLYNLYREML